MDNGENSAKERAGQSLEDAVGFGPGPGASRVFLSSSHTMLNPHSPGATLDSNLAAGTGGALPLSHFLLSWGQGI